MIPYVLLNLFAQQNKESSKSNNTQLAEFDTTHFKIYRDDFVGLEVKKTMKTYINT